MLKMTLRRQKYRFSHFCSGSVYQKGIFEKYFHVYKTNNSIDKSAF